MTASGYLAAASALPMYWKSKKAFAVPARAGLSDPELQPKFVEPAPNALDPGFIFAKKDDQRYIVTVGSSFTETGLRLDGTGARLLTPIYGYGNKVGTGNNDVTWPGKTIQVRREREPVTEVTWMNKLPVGQPHLLPVDTSLHWCYSLPGYEDYSIETAGVPIITHLHGGNTDFQFDGNPEFFYGPEIETGGRRRRRTTRVVGPQWNEVPGGFTHKFSYNTDVPAGNLWYHDHALGLTRLNVYAGMAGFFFVRDDQDTGEADNPLGLPAYPYELAYAIQDRMFTDLGALFYPAFPGDPFYDDFITGEGAELPPDVFPGGGPTALAEFFGDHMVVNGKIWPKTDVEPRNYRMRLLNGCDSRFMVIRFRMAASLASTDLSSAGAPLPFYVIGSDQGLASAATQTDTLVFEPGSRYDIVFNFDSVPADSRVIMENIGGDAPFGGDYGDALASEDFFPKRQTDRIMAFDVVRSKDTSVADNFNPSYINHYGGNANQATRVRKVALFEGMDEFGRLQPLLGTAAPTVDAAGNTVNGAIAWHSPTTELPELGSTEIWEIYNATGDAHPVHLHLVNFEVMDRRAFTSNVIEQPILQHNGEYGIGFRLENIQIGEEIDPGSEYVENAPKDMVTALPDQVTRIKAIFDKPGRYVWHCHILSHEDHEMMRVLEVVKPAGGGGGEEEPEKPKKPRRRR